MGRPKGAVQHVKYMRVHPMYAQYVSGITGGTDSLYRTYSSFDLPAPALDPALHRYLARVCYLVLPVSYHRILVK